MNRTATRILGVGFLFAFTVAIKFVKFSFATNARVMFGTKAHIRPLRPAPWTSDWHRCMELCNKIIKFVYVVRTVPSLGQKQQLLDFLFGRAQKRTTEEWANRGSSILCCRQLSLWKYECVQFILLPGNYFRRRRRVCACATTCGTTLSAEISAIRNSLFKVLFFCFLFFFVVYFFISLWWAKYLFTKYWLFYLIAENCVPKLSWY